MEQFITLPLQCRHLEHMHEGVWFQKRNGQNDNLDHFPTMAFVYAQIEP